MVTSTWRTFGKVGGALTLPSVAKDEYDHESDVSDPGVSVLVVVVVVVVVLLPPGAILVAAPVLVVYERTGASCPRWCERRIFLSGMKLH